MKTLTKENAKNGMTIICKDHTEWGAWKLNTIDGTIRGFSGEKVLNEEEYCYWKIVNE